MEEIARLDHVYQYNELMGIETLHPLVSVIDMSKCPRMRHSRRLYGFYCIFLKDVKCGDLRYGRNYYDYQEGTLVFTAPGQVVGVEDNGEVFQPKGWALLFHPDLIRGTSLGRSIDRYTFFSYESYEALHLSEQERHIVIDCLQNIAGELQHSIDKHSRTLIVSNIELLLNYSIRFYERQFTTRSDVNKDALSGFERAAQRLFPGRRPAARRGAFGTLVRRAAAPFGQLFRRPGEKGNREIGAGIHPAESHRHRQGTHVRHDQVDQRNRLRARVQVSATLHAPVQEMRGAVAQRIPDTKLTRRHGRQKERRTGKPERTAD